MLCAAITFWQMESEKSVLVGTQSLSFLVLSCGGLDSRLVAHI